MKTLGIAPEDIPREALEYINEIVNHESNGMLTVQECIQIITNPKNDFEKSLQLAMSKDEDIKSEIIKKASKRDFRAFLRDMIDGEAENIKPSLDVLREADPGEYNRTLQGWTKIAFPQQKDVNINVDVEHKITMYQRMQQQYGYSLAADGAEDAQLLEEGQQEAPMAIPVDNPSQRLSSTFDPMFFEQPEDTTPPPPIEEMSPRDFFENSWEESEEEQND